MDQTYFDVDKKKIKASMELKWHLLYKSRSGIHISFGGILSEKSWSFICKCDVIWFIFNLYDSYLIF